ncbi:MAG: hypothetical protein NDI61_02285 [Bdellovibrionaceae bacterium]|nr:hypothetical protein [Pseudobdellovibrionaceae bacterium]
MKRALALVIGIVLPLSAYTQNSRAEDATGGENPSSFQQSLLGTYWQGEVIILTGKKRNRQAGLPMRLYFAPALNEKGEIVYYFQKSLAQAGWLRRLGIKLADIKVDARCGLLPRSIQVEAEESEADIGRLNGSIMADECAVKKVDGQVVMVKTPRAIPLEKLEVARGASAREMTILAVAKEGFVEMEYRFHQVPQPALELTEWLQQVDASR